MRGFYTLYILTIIKTAFPAVYFCFLSLSDILIIYDLLLSWLPNRQKQSNLHLFKKKRDELL